jgi:hypothetical protein
MAKLTQAQQRTVSVIAHALIIKDLENKVVEMKGVEAAYLKDQSAKDRALIEFFYAELKRIPADMARMMEKDGNGTSP